HAVRPPNCRKAPVTNRLSALSHWHFPMRRKILCFSLLAVLMSGLGCRKKPANPQTPPPSVEQPAADQKEEPPTGDPIAEGLWWLYHQNYAKAHEIFSTVAKE